MSAVAYNFPGRATRVILDGQSLNIEPTLTTNLLVKLRDAQNNVAFSNVAQSGQRFDQLTTSANAGTRDAEDLGVSIPVFPIASLDTKTIVLINGGTSDIDNGDFGTVLHDRIVDYSDLWKANGADYTMVLTIPKSATHSAGENTQRLLCNDEIMANTLDFDGVVDIGGTTATPEPSHGLWDNTDTTYYDVDQIHWNEAGAQAVADECKSVLDTLIAL